MLRLTVGSDNDKVPGILSRYRVLAETAISSVKGAIRRLACNMPIGPRNEKQPPSPIYKRHVALKEWLEQLLRCWEVKPEPETKEEEEQTKEEGEDSKAPEEEENEPILISRDDPKLDKIHTIGKDARADGMPRNIPYDPNAVYVRINKKHLDERTLKYFGLPWSIVKVRNAESSGLPSN
jgi:hypothetical protein